MVLPSSRRVLQLAFGAAAVAVLSAACSRSGLDLLDYGGTGGLPSDDSGTGTTPMSACTPPAAGAVVTLATSGSGWRSIAVDSTAVYGIEDRGGPGIVVKVPLCGGPPVTLARANATALAIDDTNVYWTDSPDGSGFTVYTVDKTGGTPKALATLPDYQPFSTVAGSAIAVDSNAVYVLGLVPPDAGSGGPCSGGIMSCTPGDIIRIPLEGGDPTTLATQQAGPSAIAVDATSVYWANAGPDVYYAGESHAQGTIVSVPLGGGSATTLATRQVEPQGVFVQGAVVYWVGDDGSIASVPTSGGTPQAVQSSDLFLQGVTADDQWLYVVDANGSLETMPPTGGTPTTIASANATFDEGPAAIALDATSVYWTSGNDLLRAAK